MTTYICLQDFILCDLMSQRFLQASHPLGHLHLWCHTTFSHRSPLAAHLEPPELQLNQYPSHRISLLAISLYLSLWHFPLYWTIPSFIIHFVKCHVSLALGDKSTTYSARLQKLNTRCTETERIHVIGH